MRLTSSQVQTIKTVIARVVNFPHRVWLFGSRVDDLQKGGDIDLLVETNEIVSNHAEVICRIYGALIMALGDRKLDILFKDARTQNAPVFEIAKQTGIVL
jgi:hypothetical protein